MAESFQSSSEGSKKFLFNAIAFGIIVTSLAIAYYFAVFLPRKEKQLIDLQTAEQEQKNLRDMREQELATDRTNRETAKLIQDDCLRQGLSVSPDFAIESTHANPLFYAYDDANSVDRNARLALALSSYRDCISADPRNNKENAVLDSINSDAFSAYLTIIRHINDTLKNHPDYCDSFLLSKSTKQDYCPVK